MFKCCQLYIESCYWNLIEEKFCFDESIALYEEPVAKEEKNNNLIDNIAFYDSVSVIAGRAIVTIDPLPPKKINEPVVDQPKRLNWKEQLNNDKNQKYDTELIAIPSLRIDNASDENENSKDVVDGNTEHSRTEEEAMKKTIIKKTVSFDNILATQPLEPEMPAPSKSENTLTQLKVELRKKSLAERRMSKSLSVRIDYPKEIPIIRQSSVPKFFLDTPEFNQTESTLIKTPLTSLQSPIVCNTHGFCFDLKSVVVQMEKDKQLSYKEAPLVHKESTSRLTQIKIKLKKSKSTLSASNIPHTNYI